MVRNFGRDRQDGTLKGTGLTVPEKHQPAATQSTLVDFYSAVLAQAESLAAANESSPRTIQDCRHATEPLSSFFSPDRLLTDPRPVDFVALRSVFGAHVSAATCGNWYVRVILSAAFNDVLLDQPIRFQRPRALPPASLMRLEHCKRGALM